MYVAGGVGAGEREIGHCDGLEARWYKHDLCLTCILVELHVPTGLLAECVHVISKCRIRYTEVQLAVAATAAEMPTLP